MSGARFGVSLTLAAAFAALLGCSAVLGDEYEALSEEEFARRTGTPSASGGTSPTVPNDGASDECTSGEFRCAGAKLERCDSGAWGVQRDCIAASLCDPAGSCREPGCEIGVYSCTGAALERCDGTEFITLETCSSAANCDPVSGVCSSKSCEEGAYRCNAYALERCLADGSGWVVEEQCASSALCDDEIKRCHKPGCELGTFKCVGAQLQACDVSRTGYSNQGDPCASPSLCNEVLHSCDTPACDVGEYHCTASGALEVCNTERTGYDIVEQCKGGAYCTEAENGCLPCLEGEVRCEDDELLTCNSAQSGWEVSEVCASALFCNEAEKLCEPPTCAVGESHCTGNTLETCNSTRTGFDSEECEYCDPVGLECLFCEPDKYYCTDYEADGDTLFGLVRCRSDGEAYRQRSFPPQECAADLCDAAAGICHPCLEGQFRCDQGEGSESLMRCSSEQIWVLEETCAVDESCNAVDGACDI